MKSRYLIGIIACSALSLLIVVGLVVAIIGRSFVMRSATLSSYEYAVESSYDEYTTSAPSVYTETVVEDVAPYEGSKNSSKHNGVLVDTKIGYADINKIDIDLHADQVTILPSEGNEIHIVQTGVNLHPDRIIRIQKDQHKLEIDQKDISFLAEWNPTSKSMVDIYLPDAYQGALEIDLGSGSVLINRPLYLRDLELSLASGSIVSDHEIVAPNVELSVMSGDVVLQSLKTQTYDFELTSGAIQINALAGSGEIEVASGDLSLGNVVLDEKLDIEIASGNVRMDIAENPALELTGRKASGNVNAYFPISNTHGSLYGSVGNAPYKQIKVELASGSLDINQAS